MGARSGPDFSRRCTRAIRGDCWDCPDPPRPHFGTVRGRLNTLRGGWADRYHAAAPWVLQEETRKPRVVTKDCSLAVVLSMRIARGKGSGDGLPRPVDVYPHPRRGTTGRLIDITGRRSLVPAPQRPGPPPIDTEPEPGESTAVHRSPNQLALITRDDVAHQPNGVTTTPTPSSRSAE